MFFKSIAKANLTCTNGCKLPAPKKVLIKKSNGEYTFGYDHFEFCPICGALTPSTYKTFSDFFEVYNLHPKLNKAKELFLKSEFSSAVREAVVVLENCIKQKSNEPNLRGKDLVCKAFSFKYDKQTQVITSAPKIAINKLKTESQRNEQEGIMMMLIGFFQGPRNIFQHNCIGASVHMMLSILLQSSFFIYQIDNGISILNNGYWIREKVRNVDILGKMPKKSDKKLFIKMLKKKNKKLLKIHR